MKLQMQKNWMQWKLNQKRAEIKIQIKQKRKKTLEQSQTRTVNCYTIYNICSTYYKVAVKL